MQTQTGLNVQILLTVSMFASGCVLTPGPGMPRRPSGPDLPGCPWGPTGPVFPTGPWDPVVPYRTEGQTQTGQNRSEFWKAPCTTMELSASHYPYLGSLHALLPFFSCSTYMTLWLTKTMLLR